MGISLLLTNCMLRMHTVTPALLVALAAPAAAQTIDTLALREHTRFLASDQLLGRGTGTEGERLAAAYIVRQLVEIGLQPIDDRGSFLHPIPLRAAHLTGESRVSVVAGGDSSSYDAGSGFVVSAGGHGALRDFRGRAVLLGPPEHARELIAAELWLDGGVAVFLGPLGPHARELVPALSRAGATGIVILVGDEETFDLYRSRGESRLFVDAPVDDPVWQPALPVITAGPALSAALLRGHTLTAALLDGSATRAVDLERTVVARIRAHVQDVPAANVAAVLPGSDPLLRDQYVVYTAHYDHLGVGAPDQSGDSIYNGFSDNAAGVAMLLAIARAMLPRHPARSVLFLFFTGEERGLLGSSYFAATSTIPPRQMVGLINLDAGAPPAPPVSWRIAGGTETPLGPRAQRLAEQHGWSATLSAASPNSDYWPFLQRGVASVFIIPGPDWENTTPAERDALRSRWDRYHRADDHWHPDFPFSGLQRYAGFALLLGLELATAPAP
jgi:Zn-dependent M28 family amino/carboxypeptidase